MKLLGMPKASVIDVSVNNENIRFSAKDVKRGLSCFNWLVDKIGTEQEQTPKTIVFCRSINDVSVVLSYLLKKLGHLAYIDEKLYFSLSLVSRFALMSRSARNIAFAPLGS